MWWGLEKKHGLSACTFLINAFHTDQPNIDLEYILKVHLNYTLARQPYKYFTCFTETLLIKRLTLYNTLDFYLTSCMFLKALMILHCFICIHVFEIIYGN